MMRPVFYFICLFAGTVSGFLAQNGGTSAPHPQSSDQTIQNLLNLIVNEQNSRIQLQNMVTTLSDKVVQLQTSMDQLQKSSDAKINQTEYEMKIKLNEMSSRLAQMEKVNADVSKQLIKEKNNREHLEEIYADLEKRVLHLSTNNKTVANQSEIHIIESKITNFEVSTLNNLTDITTKLGNLTTEFERTKTESKVTNQMLISNNTHLQDKVVAIETTLSNIDNDSNKTLSQLRNMTTEIFNLKKLFQNVTMDGLNKPHVSVGFSVVYPNTSSGSPLLFRIKVYNTGDGYNMSTGIFTCKYPGLYFFTATMFRAPGIRESYCYITINGNGHLAVNSGAALTDGFLSGSGSMVYHLQAGDKVSLSSCVGVNGMFSYSSFSGFLISL